MFEYTGCDGIMIARGAQGNPWIFKTILDGKEYIPTNKERLDVILEHINYELENETYENNAVFKLRKHIAWYLKGLKNSNLVKEKVYQATKVYDIINILKKFEEEYRD